MSDDALIVWLSGGAPVALPEEEAAARRHADFRSRFEIQLKQQDLGPTEELHEQAMALAIYQIHRELNAFGEEEYSSVWQHMSAPSRRAIKAYISMAAKL